MYALTTQSQRRYSDISACQSTFGFWCVKHTWWTNPLHVLFIFTLYDWMGWDISNVEYLGKMIAVMNRLQAIKLEIRVIRCVGHDGEASDRLCWAWFHVHVGHVGHWRFSLAISFPLSPPTVEYGSQAEQFDVRGISQLGCIQMVAGKIR